MQLKGAAHMSLADRWRCQNKNGDAKVHKSLRKGGKLEQAKARRAESNESVNMR